MTSWQAGPTRDIMRVGPFRGVTYAERAGALADLTFTPPTSWSSLPADLLGTIDQHHILHLLAPAFAGQPEEGAERARTTLTDWLADGVLRADDEPAMYVYSQPGDGADVLAVIAVVDLLPGGDGPFLDHEEVIASHVDTQETLERTTRAQVEPILALHRDAPSLLGVLTDVTVRPPDLTIPEPTGGAHRLWRVVEPATQARIVRAIPDEPALIADGHHRHAAWSRLAERSRSGPAGRALALLSDARQPGIRLGAIHRVLSGLELDRVIGSPAVRCVALAGRSDALAYLDDGPTAGCVLHSGGEFYAVTPALPNAACAAPELAVCHLHSGWLARWDVPEGDVGYVHGLDEAIALTATAGVAVLLPAPSIDAVIAAAHDQRPLPRKATSFGPKPLIGTVFRTWDDS
ncbi:DUF1015 family protein [Solicola gregarius]|uniref:DUF1015 domain-containing protein n=1 Tax=Solicola gregarius TaxID=2908642 RepID=A0AA46TH61_9ACTN|nr:DUF1015 family protein [Solicola gregarius]UYM05200.1 DUF1015 domain-containing protein [Solicola gregarius]